MEGRHKPTAAKGGKKATTQFKEVKVTYHIEEGRDALRKDAGQPDMYSGPGVIRRLFR